VFPYQSFKGYCVNVRTTQGWFDSRLITQLVQLLFATGQREFKSPLTNVVHCLITLPLDGAQSDLFPKELPTKVVQHIIDTLDRSVPQDTESVSDTNLDESLSPVITLLSSIYQVALDPADPVKNFMRQSLLPTDEYYFPKQQVLIFVEIVSSPLVRLKVYQVVSSVS
jgi:hypothetical protein